MDTLVNYFPGGYCSTDLNQPWTDQGCSIQSIELWLRGWDQIIILRVDNSVTEIMEFDIITGPGGETAAANRVPTRNLSHFLSPLHTGPTQEGGAKTIINCQKVVSSVFITTI